MLSKVRAWFTTSSSIIGTSGIGGALAAVATGQTTWLHALPALVAGVVAIAMPQRPQIAADAKTIVTDTVKMVGDLNVVSKP